MLNSDENSNVKTDLKTMKASIEMYFRNLNTLATCNSKRCFVLHIPLNLDVLLSIFSVKLSKCVLPRHVNKEKRLHTTVVPFQRIDSKSDNNKEENLFEVHDRSGFDEEER